MTLPDAAAPTAAPATFPCTYPGCNRAFPRALSRTHHLSSVHGIRSLALEAVGRQERRDQRRTVEDFRWLARGPARRGPLNPGQVEQVRRRIIFSALQLAREQDCDVAEVCVSIFDLCAASLKSAGHYAMRVHAERAWGTDNVGVAHKSHKSGRREPAGDPA